MKSFKLLSVFIGLATLVSCREPLSSEIFVRNDQMVDGAYEFALDMSRGEYSYDLSFYTVIDGKGVSELPLYIELISPSGTKYAENVSMEVGESTGDLQLYRSSLVPVEYGIWTMRVTPMIEIRQMRGMGLINERKEIKRIWDTVSY